MIPVWFWFGSSLEGLVAPSEENFRTTTPVALLGLRRYMSASKFP
jgi:hypothetical protein